MKFYHQKLILMGLFFIFCFKLHANTCKLLIIGCGRSGTTYMTRLLQESNYKISHEAFGLDGSVSWPMVVNNYYWNDLICNDTFDHVFHIVRHPLFVITSWHINIHTDHPVWRFICKHVPEIKLNDSLIVKCAKYWYYWNLLAEKKAEWRFQIESFNEDQTEFIKRSCLILDTDKINQIATNENHWNYTSDKITWSELKMELPPDLYFNIRDMAFRYGYTY